MTGARHHCGPALLILVALAGLQPTRSRAAPADAGPGAPVATRKPGLRTPRLYVLDCGTLLSASAEEYGLARNEVADPNMADPCFLVMHPKGILLFDTGLPDRLAAAELDAVFGPGATAPPPAGLLPRRGEGSALVRVRPAGQRARTSAPE